MVEMQILKGNKTSWTILSKLGEGDAGEVFLVRSVSDQKEAILKKPSSTTINSLLSRQATQIAGEAEILTILNGLSLEKDFYSIRSPRLFDISPADSEAPENFFIVVEKANGIDLSSLAKFAFFSPEKSTKQNGQLTTELSEFVTTCNQSQRIPVLLLLRCLDGVFTALQAIHGQLPDLPGDVVGVVWNDVKPEHIFWAPQKKEVWLIDWGNSYLIKSDKSQGEKEQSYATDFEQYFLEFQKYFELCDQNLNQLFNWGKILSSWESLNSRMELFKSSYQQTLADEEAKCRRLNRHLKDLLSRMHPDLHILDQIKQAQVELYKFGEIPDLIQVDQFAARLISAMVKLKNTDHGAAVCQWVMDNGVMSPKWRMIKEIFLMLRRLNGSSLPLVDAISMAMDDNFSEVLWLVSEYSSIYPGAYLNENIVDSIRQHILGAATAPTPPWILINRLYLTMQAAIHQQTSPPSQSSQGSGVIDSPAVVETQTSSAEKLLVALKEISQKWREVEPDPPGAGISYAYIDIVLDETEKIYPEQTSQIRRSLIQPKAQVDIIISAWESQQFDLASRGLRKLLIWDPNRLRIFKISRLFSEAAQWSKKILAGPQKIEKLSEFITKMELIGREFLTRIGSTSWLDRILAVFVQLRKGANTKKIISDDPEILQVMPWLKDFDTTEDISALAIKLSDLARKDDFIPIFQGKSDHEISFPKDYQLTSILDHWIPEAAGSSARVFGVKSSRQPGNAASAAIKILRPGEEKYALPLFEEEAQILPLLAHVPGVVRLHEFGFIQFSSLEFMAESWKGDPGDIAARAHPLGADQGKQFLKNLDKYSQSNWLPYFILELKHSENNLLSLTDSGQTRGQLFPVKKGLIAAIQACEIFEASHRYNIVYRDHKILHYYWEDVLNGLTIIDWNVARWHPEGLRQEEKDFDLVQFGARALHHIFTGRPAPGALPLGPNRPAEIEAAQHSYKTQWTYDDRRLPDELKTIIIDVLSGQYHSARQLRTDLTRCYINYTQNHSNQE